MVQHAESYFMRQVEATNKQLNRLGLLRSMLRIRRVEEAIADRYAEQEMRCPMHLCIGQYVLPYLKMM
jgi:TPP-dependent pyruvate/acetoin dehydrogenase alpha subunit